MTQINLTVSGMKCGGCIKNATKALSQISGYENSEFDLDRGTAKVSGELNEQEVIKALTDAGYPASTIT